MSFTQELRQAADDMFKKVYDHPFVRGIADESLTSEQLIHYVKQDYEYLNAMIRTRAFTMSKCTSREEMALLNEGISFILNDESHPHNNFCDVAGVSYEAVRGEPLAPNAHHYSQYMLQVSASGTLGEALAVSLPCPWIYQYIGERLIKEYRPGKDHLFYDWIAFYGEQEMPRIEKTLKWLDNIAESSSDHEKKLMYTHFMNGCKMEYMFFDMAYTRQTWPV